MFGNGKQKNRCCRQGTQVLQKPGALPLCNAQSGKRLRVAGLEGGRHVCARMASMGIYPGVEMEVLCGGGCGGCPCLVRVHGGTLSLGRGVSEKIMVTSVM